MTEPKPKRRRRWYQFSLRTLMLFMVVCAVGSAWVGSKLEATRREQAVVAKLESVGGWVEYHDIDGPSWVTKHFHRVRAVYLNETRVLTGDILHLDQMDDSDLRALDWLKVTDDTLVPLKDLMRLEYLGLSGSQITDVGLEYLNEMTSLAMLWLENTQVTDEGVEKLQQALPDCDIRH